MFIKSKKGLSEVVTTVIIIVLVLAAIAIVWSVINGLISGGVDDINLNSKCLGSSVEAISAPYTNTSLVYYNVTLKRTVGNDAISGVKLVLSNSTTTGSKIDVSGNIAQLDTRLITSALGVGNATLAEVYVYFKDSSENELLCPTPNKFEF